MTETQHDLLNDLAVFDAKARRRLDYLYHLALNHPTAEGRKRAAIAHADKTNYLNDVHEAWKTISMALWPKEKINGNAG